MGIPIIDWLTQFQGLMQGNAAAAPEEERARQLEEENLAAARGLSGPSVNELGQQQGRSELAGISLDPRLRAAQIQALDKLDVASRGNDDLEYRAAMDQARNETNRQAGSQEAAIEQALQAQGNAGGPAAAALKAQAVQAAAGRNSAMGFQAAAEAQRRAIDATTHRADLAGRIEGADYDRAAQLAAANDRINAFNTATRNTAQQQHFNNGMGIYDRQSDARTGAANSAWREADRQRGIAQAQANVAQQGFDSAADTAWNVVSGGMAPKTSAAPAAPTPITNYDPTKKRRTY